MVKYRSVVGDEAVDRIYGKGARVRNVHAVMVNSTAQGGGVAEILRSLLPLINNAGPMVGWRTLKGHPDFYRVTKRIHNALQGEDIDLTREKKRVFEKVNEDFAKYTHFNHDLVVIHDPQPLPLIENYRREQPWVWRCHIDLSDPDEELWEYLKNFIIPYDYEVYQLEDFVWKSGSFKIIYPAIDPLSTKNEEIGRKLIDEYMEKIGIDPDDPRPLIVQVSRFDPWKDPLGVIEVFDKVKEEMDARLLLVGAFADDDPEAEGIYEKVLRETEGRDDITVAPNLHDIAVNAIQREADVVLQKSLREGFGLTVTEAMWKETPVVGGNVGGIPKQIVDGETGYLVDPSDYEEVAEKVLDLLSSPQLREEMGRKGREKVREEFLITRQVEDWLDVFAELV
ncbi:MAG: glycosyltransferase [Candidatus Hadarchaeia archaeon]